MRTARDYQVACDEAVSKCFREGKRGVAVEIFTGGGKGFLIANWAKKTFARRKRVLVLVNRDTLVGQLSESIVEQGLHPQLERGMDRASKLADIVVGSIQTLQGDRLKTWRPDHFDLVITDEAHFAAAKSFKATLDYFESSYHIFMSATMERHDKQGLWHGVNHLAYSMPLQAGINEGWLVPFEFEELPVPIDISDKQATKKMWTQKDEDGVFDEGEYLPRMFREAASRAHDRHGLFFWHGRGPSKEATKYFNAEGIESRHIDCYLSNNQIKDIKAWFAQPGPKACHCSDYFNYGYDNPLIDLIGMMRIRRSVPMMKQNLGRGTRPAIRVDDYATADERRAAIASSAKPHCRVLDLMLRMGEVANKFADPTALITDDPKERDFVKEAMRKEGRAVTMEELELKLKAKRHTDFEKQLIKQAEDAANAARKATCKRGEPYIEHILRRPHNGKDASEKAMWYLRKLGFNRDIRLSAQQAYLITDLYKSRKEAQLTLV